MFTYRRKQKLEQKVHLLNHRALDNPVGVSEEKRFCSDFYQKIILLSVDTT